MAAEADALTGGHMSSKRNGEEEEEDSPPTVPDQAAAAPDVDKYCSDDDDDEADPVIRNLNLMSRLNLMTPEWIEDRRRRHYEEIDLFNRSYDALENEDAESDDEAFTAEFEEWSKRHWASIDFSGVNTVDGVDAVAVYPDFLLHHEEDDEDKDKDDDENDDAAVLRPEKKDPKDKVHDDACAAESSS